MELMMLTEQNDYPEEMLSVPAEEIYRILPGPTLIHLKGRREEPLFVSTLLHGNEDTGWVALQGLLQHYRREELPRSLSIFIGNVEAARHKRRRLDDQPDYNRIWSAEGHTPEHHMMQRICKEMKVRKVFASIDVHNNTGVNPHYSCINRLDHRFYRLASLFGRTVVYFIRPTGVQTMAFAELCPSVTVECGRVGDEAGIDHAKEFIHACLHLSEIPATPVAPHDMALFHTVATVRVPPENSFGFGKTQADFILERNLDHLNFHELPPGTVFGRLGGKPEARLQVLDEHGQEVGEGFLDYRGGRICNKVALMPSMFTLNREVILQDCLGYFMERIDYGPHQSSAGDSNLDK
jgi:succinylglutamate desuccinylase/aspartoacylase family protein